MCDRLVPAAVVAAEHLLAEGHGRLTGAAIVALGRFLDDQSGGEQVVLDEDLATILDLVQEQFRRRHAAALAQELTFKQTVSRLEAEGGWRPVAQDSLLALTAFLHGRMFRAEDRATSTPQTSIHAPAWVQQDAILRSEWESGWWHEHDRREAAIQLPACLRRACFPDIKGYDDEDEEGPDPSTGTVREHLSGPEASHTTPLLGRAGLDALAKLGPTSTDPAQAALPRSVTISNNGAVWWVGPTQRYLGVIGRTAESWVPITARSLVLDACTSQQAAVRRLLEAAALPTQETP